MVVQARQGHTHRLQEAAMSRTRPRAAPLSPHWAFVVHLREGTA